MFYGHCRPMARTPIRLPFFHGGRSHFQQREVVLPGWGGPKSDDEQGVSRSRGPLPFGGTGRNTGRIEVLVVLGRLVLRPMTVDSDPRPTKCSLPPKRAFARLLSGQKACSSFRFFRQLPSCFRICPS